MDVVGVHNTSTSVTVGTASAVAAMAAAEIAAAAGPAVSKPADGSSQETHVYGVQAASPAATAHVHMPAVVNMAARAAEPLKDVSVHVVYKFIHGCLHACWRMCAFLCVCARF